MSDATTAGVSGQAVETKPFHEWVLEQLQAGLHWKFVGLFRDMLMEVTIPAKHDEIIAAWNAVAEQARFEDTRGVVVKLLAEKAKAEEKANEKNRRCLGDHPANW